MILKDKQGKYFDRRAFLKLCGVSLAGTALAGGGSFAYGSFIERQWLSIESVPVPIRNLPDAFAGFTIAHLSDIHYDQFQPADVVRQAVQEINRRKPDIVAITGDFVTLQGSHAEDVAFLLRDLDPKEGSFACMGNHDWSNRDTRVIPYLTTAGIRSLCNESVTFTRGGKELTLVGLNDAWFGGPNLNNSLKGHRNNSPVVTLMHEPDMADEFARDPRLSLQLSGHSHGGQICLPGYGPLLLPMSGQKYPSGLYRVREAWVYTNRGLGVISIPIRMFCRPELTMITLVPA